MKEAIRIAKECLGTVKFHANCLYLLLPLAGLVEFGLGIRNDATALKDQDYDALRPVVESLYREGDLLVVAPRWAEPHVRRALGDKYFPLEAVARSDSQRFRRALEVSLFGEDAPDTRSFREVEQQSAGRLSVRVLENPDVEPIVFDFVEHLGPQYASAFGTEPEIRCTWSETARVASGGLGGHPTFPAKRFTCQDDFYLNVSATIIADEKFLPRRCIYAHPTARGARVVRFDHVPLGKRIVGHSGIHWMLERARVGAAVEIEVKVDGESLAVFSHADGDGFKRFEFDLKSHAKKSDAQVDFVVSTSDYMHRHFCFQADSR